MTLRRLAPFLLACLTFTPVVFAQSSAPPQTLNAANQCARIGAVGQATVGIQVVGTWSGTLQPQVSIQGQVPANASVTPANSATAQATITADGVYSTSVAGYTTFLLCVSSYSSGAATVYLNAASGGSGTGGTTAGALLLNPSTPQTIKTSAFGGLNIQQTPCSSLTVYMQNDAGCGGAFNSYVLQNIAGLTATYLRKGLNIYLEDDGAQGSANYDGLQVNEGITGDAYTSPSMGHAEAAEFQAQVSGALPLNVSVAPTNPSGNTWVYTFTSAQPGLVASNGWAGASVGISGYTGGATGNNGIFTVVSSNATTISVTNVTGTATSTGTPLVSPQIGQSNGVKIRNGTLNGATVLIMTGILNYNPQFVGGSTVANFYGYKQDAPNFPGGSTVTNWTSVEATAPGTGAGVTNSYGVVTSGGTAPIVVEASTSAASFIGHAAPSALPPYTLQDGYYGGTGSPNGVLAAAVGSFYAQQDGAAGSTLWLKVTGTGNTGWLTYSSTIAGGATFTSSGGLDEGSLVGGATAGQFTTATVTTGSTVITMGNSATAPQGWHCSASDKTHPLDIIIGTSRSPTTCTLTVALAITVGDVIEFSAVGY